MSFDFYNTYLTLSNKPQVPYLVTRLTKESILRVSSIKNKKIKVTNKWRLDLFMLSEFEILFNLYRKDKEIVINLYGNSYRLKNEDVMNVLSFIVSSERECSRYSGDNTFNDVQDNLFKGSIVDQEIKKFMLNN